MRGNVEQGGNPARETGRSLKTQQRAFTSRPLAQFAVQEEQDPVPYLRVGTL